MGDMLKKKLILRYIFLCIPFIIGIFLYSGGIYNIFSSALFFGGGYITIKNIFDYRKINKNIRKIFANDDKKIRFDIKNDCMDNVVRNKKRLEIFDVFNNIDLGNDLINNDNIEKRIYKYNASDNIPLLKNTRRHIRVRRRYWE